MVWRTSQNVFCCVWSEADSCPINSLNQTRSACLNFKMYQPEGEHTSYLYIQLPEECFHIASRIGFESRRDVWSSFLGCSDRLHICYICYTRAHLHNVYISTSNPRGSLHKRDGFIRRRCIQEEQAPLFTNVLLGHTSPSGRTRRRTLSSHPREGN